ncbi:MAG TPA: hypothetical protein VMH81_11880, partial [Bryobacteraceae bacterium]|nr:hypothetical protein [Bryobacteraceae bacterium]
MSLAGPHKVQANGRVYTVVDDCTTAYQAVITGMVTDEIFGEFLDPGLTVAVSRPDLDPRVAGNGLYTIAGYPAVSFPHLNAASASLTLVFSAAGFRPVTLPITIQAGSAFPVAVPPVALRRVPVRIQGRVMKDSIPRTPVSGALIHSLDNANIAGSHLTVLRSPLYFPHPAGCAVQSVTLTDFGTATLNGSAAAGTQVLNLSTRAGLGAGALVQLSAASGATMEYGVVDHLGPGAPLAGQVFLT